MTHASAYRLSFFTPGGNNYGKLSGGEVVTAYAPDTVIDSLLLRHQVYRCLLGCGKCLKRCFLCAGWKEKGGSS